MDTKAKRDKLIELVDKIAGVNPSDGVKWRVAELVSLAKAILDELDKANERIDDLEGDVAGLTDGQNQVEADLELRLDVALDERDAALAEVERLEALNDQVVAREAKVAAERDLLLAELEEIRDKTGAIHPQSTLASVNELLADWQRAESAYETEKAEVERLKDGLAAIIESRRCYDGNCIWGKPKGVHTNGGCEALKMNSPEARREIRAIAAELRALVNTEAKDADNE